MVRLRGIFVFNPNRFIRISIPIWCDWENGLKEHSGLMITFQFQYGAIERVCSIHQDIHNQNFNSNMVRLRELSPIVSRHYLRHFNSNMVRLRVHSLNTECRQLPISIPIWCDWENIAPCRCLDGVKFQFQYGAIERACALSRLLGARPISIPIWCDWETKKELQRVANSHFNSNMVRLRAAAEIKSCYIWIYFNSNMVRLRVIVW